MRTLVIALMVVACGKGETPPPPATGSAMPIAKPVEPDAAIVEPSRVPPPGGIPTVKVTPIVPPGLGGVRMLPTEHDYRIVARRRFRSSSVRGDFRVLRTAAGIVVSWKTELSARSLDGKRLWGKADQGRAMAVSPDGSRIVTNNQAGTLLILDATTGEPIGAPVQLGGKDTEMWISAFVWMLDGKHILALDAKRVYLLDWTGALKKELAIACASECFLSAAAGVTNDEAIVADTGLSSTARLHRLKIPEGTVVATSTDYGRDPDLGLQRANAITDGLNELVMFDATTLALRWKVPRPGMMGVKFAPDDTGWREWTPLPKLSPDGRYVIVNDRAGRLWLLDAKQGKRLLAYPTALVDFVEDVIWLEDGSLIAIDNDGRVLRIAGTPAKVVWAEPDGPENAKWDEW